MADSIELKMVKAVRKKVRVLSDKRLEQTLEWSAGSLADAYRQGVEECQHELIQRIEAIHRGVAP